MYLIDQSIKSDPIKRWNLPDRIFFACGACHILAYCFIQGFNNSHYKVFWIKPKDGHRGNHVVAVDENNNAFDYHGFVKWDALKSHIELKARRFWPDWSADIIELPFDVLVSEKKSKMYDGLWLREPSQFLHDPIPRARQFIQNKIERLQF